MSGSLCTSDKQPISPCSCDCNRCVVKGICQGKLGDETRLDKNEVPKGMRVKIPSHRPMICVAKKKNKRILGQTRDVRKDLQVKLLSHILESCERIRLKTLSSLIAAEYWRTQFGPWDCSGWSPPLQGGYQAGSVPAGSTSQYGKGLTAGKDRQHARVMELAYLSDSKSEFCGFESHLGYQYLIFIKIFVIIFM